MNLNIARELKDQCLSDEAIASLSDKVLLVSSVQLAKILGKKNDNSLRASRSNKTGFKSYKDKQGNVYYNLIKVLNELGIKL
jgi:hypothetical protein|tara:strand:+ start:2383 stop:2628 length:246 start_codon:yes stop_codon:yes gene_type:complete